MTDRKQLAKDLTELLGVKPTGDLANYEYNTWLDFFRDVPTAKLMKATEWLQENLPIEAYAAASRWIEIVGNPHRIDKLLQSKLDKDEEEDLMALAVGDDQEAFYVALVKKTARELNDAATAQEVARLSMNLKIFQGELANIRSKKARKGSLLDKIMQSSARPPDPPKIANKRPKTATKKKGTKCKSSSKKKRASSVKKKPTEKVKTLPQTSLKASETSATKSSILTETNSKEKQNENDTSH